MKIEKTNYLSITSGNRKFNEHLKTALNHVDFVFTINYEQTDYWKNVKG
jgi:hypothetical protein